MRCSRSARAAARMVPGRFTARLPSAPSQRQLLVLRPGVRTLSTSRIRPAPSSEMSAATSDVASVRFSHVHMYCDKLRSIEEYKKLEEKLSAFANSSDDWGFDRSGADIASGREKWLTLSKQHGDPATGSVDPSKYLSSSQDVVEQLLVGGGFRIKGQYNGTATRSFVVTSKDPNGAQFVLTAHEKYTLDDLASKGGSCEADALNHFDASHLARYAKGHKRQGVALLGFSVSRGDVERIKARYEALHPKLLPPNALRQYGGTKLLEVYAYYQGDSKVSDADTGTVLRFTEVGDGEDIFALPGVERVEASFDNGSVPLYSDHWVSNVKSRTGFLDTLNDTLGFCPKVDFNAGVVAAGEAQIESTVTGNTPGTKTTDKEMALTDQGQIYLPINNALSEVGHVHLYLDQLGQGIQHIASRVADLPSFIQRANDYRKMTGSGLSFLSIPASYYGYLTAERLVRDAGIDSDAAEHCIVGLSKAGIINDKDCVELDVTRERITAALPAGMPDGIEDIVLRGRYNNLYDLLRDNLSEELYLSVVRNQILVDIQGEDVLMQIFTSSILQRTAGQEAPFLEFIQRKCSECPDENGNAKPIRPGCGGFGIRNFLTLFLSIEASAAMSARALAMKAGDADEEAFQNTMVDTFIRQLTESNPILTRISDAMTNEGLALERGDAAEVKRWSDLKDAGQQELMVTSTNYKNTVRQLREGRTTPRS